MNETLYHVVSGNRVAGVALVLCLACGAPEEGAAAQESFLQLCETSADCTGGLTCEYSAPMGMVCTRLCTRSEECEDLALYPGCDLGQHLCVMDCATPAQVAAHGPPEEECPAPLLCADNHGCYLP